MLPTWDAAVPQWSPAFGAGKSHRSPNLLRPGSSAAMEPSFWSWEKGPHRRGGDRGHPAAMEPSFWSWEKSRPTESSSQSVQSPQWSPAFGAGKRALTEEVVTEAIQPQWSPAFGAGKSPVRPSPPARVSSRRNGAQLLELGKGRPHSWLRGLIQPQWSPAFGAGKRSRSMPFLRVTEMAAMEPSFWSWEKGRSILVHGKGGRRNGAQLLELGKGIVGLLRSRSNQAAMEPSFWSWEKEPPQPGYGSVNSAAMEPSFWSWEKGLTKLVQRKVHPAAAMEPSFWSWEKVTRLAAGVLGGQPQWSPAFGAGKRSKTSLDNKRLSKSRNGAQLLELGKGRMRPLRWQRLICRNGAQLLELGKAPLRSLAHLQDLRRNGAQLLELGKA